MKSLLLLLLFCSTALAAPWRYESGLPAPNDDTPQTVDGVEHPFLVWKGFALGIQGDAFVSYRLDWRQGQFTHEFELSRLQLGGFVSYRHLAGLEVAFESIRSSSGQSYFGIDGNSIVTRVKFAYVEATPFGKWLSLRGGIIPDVFLNWMEASWGFRVQGPLGLERDGFFTPGDLGASLEVALPWKLGSLALAYENGEGLNLSEQNNGKNTTVALRLQPRVPGLFIHLLYRDGSLGVGEAADSRLAGGLSYTGRRLGAGVLGVWGLGWRGIGSRDAGFLTVWARGELPHRLFLFARADVLWPDAREAGSTQTRLIGGLAWALPALVRILASYEATIGSGLVAEQVPAVGEHLLLLQLEARL